MLHTIILTPSLPLFDVGSVVHYIRVYSVVLWCPGLAGAWPQWISSEGAPVVSPTPPTSQMPGASGPGVSVSRGRGSSAPWPPCPALTLTSVIRKIRRLPRLLFYNQVVNTWRDGQSLYLASNLLSCAAGADFNGVSKSEMMKIKEEAWREVCAGYDWTSDFWSGVTLSL